jgi:hypothetical protein
MVAEALHAFGELHYGVNNTGIGGEFGSARETAVERR